MYKVSEVAEMLSVEKVKIFEALIVHGELLAPYVKKERHLSYINDIGVRKIEAIIFNKNIVFEEEEVIEAIIEDEIIENDQLDKIIEKHEKRKSDLKNEIIDLKRSVNILDKELRRKDEAILNYQVILKEDLLWLIKLESKIDIAREELNSITNRKSTFLEKFKR